MLQLRVVGEVEVQATISNTSPARFQLPVAPPVIAGVARQGVAMVTVNSPARRVSMGERDESSSGSDDKVIEGDIKLELGTNGDIENGIVEHSESVCDYDEDKSVTEQKTPEEEMSNKSVIIDFSSAVDTANGVVEEQMDTEMVEVVEEVLEAADMFWDSVASKTQALATPNSFKTHLGRPYK
jgi:hypothetical protein